MIGCLGRIVGFLILVVLVWVAWSFGPEISERFRGGLSRSAPVADPSPELAEIALNRFQQVVEGDTAQLSFTGPEIESVLRYDLTEYLPAGVGEPTVRFLDGEAVLGVRVSRTLLPQVSELDRVLEILPDTVSLQLRGTLIAQEGSDAAFVIRRIDVAGIPIPRRYFAPIIAGLDPRDPSALPVDAVRIPLPAGVRSAMIQGDRLTLTMDRR
jgi:hypothetical protein